MMLDQTNKAIIFEGNCFIEFKSPFTIIKLFKQINYKTFIISEGQIVNIIIILTH